MAKFRDSTIDATVVDASNGQVLRSSPPPRAAQTPRARSEVCDRSIGDILSELRDLTPDQVERILAHQRERGVRFGEAAVDLGMATKDDILVALSQQFHYPYATEQQRLDSPELVALNEPFGARAEAFRALRSQLLMRAFPDNEPRRALAVISPDQGDGKTYCAANLAVTLAQLGGRTLLVDADLRGPRLHEVFSLTNRSGLSGVLSGRADDQVIQVAPGISSLMVLPVGTMPPNPLELVERPAFGLLIRELTNKFDHVIVDTPAAVFGSDAAVIAARCGNALVVARKNRSRVAHLQDLVDSFSGSPTRIAGVVVNEF